MDTDRTEYPPDAEELRERRNARRRRTVDPAPWEHGTRDVTEAAIADVRNAQARARTVAPTGRTGGTPRRRGARR